MSLYLLDVDGTLISSFMLNPDKDYHTWDILPGRKEKLHELLADGHKIGIVTNQAGIAFYQGWPSDFQKKIKKVFGELELDPKETPIQVCYHHPKARNPKWREDPSKVSRRKPSGEMIREHMRDLGYGPEDTFYIGDMEVDEQAAADAGVQFYWEYEFFA